MYALFIDNENFNEDISSWNVSNVVNMRMVFESATSFTHQLGGAWPTSTAGKYMMFHNSPGTIAGKVKNAHGTIE